MKLESNTRLGTTVITGTTHRSPARTRFPTAAERGERIRRRDDRNP